MHHHLLQQIGQFPFAAVRERFGKTYGNTETQAAGGSLLQKGLKKLKALLQLAVFLCLNNIVETEIKNKIADAIGGGTANFFF